MQSIYQMIPPVIIKAVNSPKLSALRKRCDEIQRSTTHQISIAFGVAALFTLMAALACLKRPDLLPNNLQSVAVAGWALCGLTVGFTAAAGVSFFAWRHHRALLTMQLGALITQMERQCSLKVILRWWSKVQKVSDIPGSFKDLTIKIAESTELTMQDARTYLKALEGASRLVGAFRRDHVFASILGVPVFGQPVIEGPAREAVSSSVEVSLSQADDEAGRVVTSMPDGSRGTVEITAPTDATERPVIYLRDERPDVAPVVEPGLEQEPVPVKQEAPAFALTPAVQQQAAESNPVKASKVVSIDSARPVAKPQARQVLAAEPVGYSYEQVSPRQLPQVTAKLESIDEARGWGESHCVRVSLYGGLPSAWPSDQEVRRAFAAMKETDWHTYLVVTTAPAKVQAVANDILRSAPNIWVGTPVAKQEDIARRVPALCQLNASVKFVHATVNQPLNFLPFATCKSCDHASDGECGVCGGSGYLLQWILAGGGSGPSASPVHTKAFLSLMEQGKRFGHFAFTGWGDWVHEDELRQGDASVFVDAVEQSMNKKLESRLCEGGGYAFRIGVVRPVRKLNGRYHNGSPKTNARVVDTMFPSMGQEA